MGTTTKLNIGKIPVSKGEYQEGTAYQRLNQVTMLGSTYQSKIDDNTSAPAQMGADGAVENINTDKWLCVAVGNVSAAKKVVYNNETSGLEAGNVQEAIDEVKSKVSDLFTSNVINTEDGNYIFGKVIQDNGGYNADTYAGYATTGYIKCHKNQIFTFAYGTAVEVWVAFFDKNKNAISSRFYHKTTSTVSIPDDANIKYFRVSYKISNAKDCLYDYDGTINTISKYAETFLKSHSVLANDFLKIDDGEVKQIDELILSKVKESLFTSNVINTEDGNYIFGKVIQDNGGYNADTYAGYATTGYIKCHKNQIFTFAYGTAVEVWVAFFDKNKNAISSRFYHKTTSTVSIPDDANIKYFRVSYKISNAKDCLYDYDGTINTISKYGFINMLASKIHIQELNCDKISCKEFIQSADSERLKADWEFACSKILCIGDSLTDGLYVPNSSGVYEVGIVEENYPYYLGRMLNASIKNVGKSGSHPSKFYNDWILKLTYTDYDFVFIWLGTNGGMKNPASADAQPRSPMYEAYYYEQIIKKIKDANPNLKIVLATVFAVGNISDSITPASVSETNNIINSIGKKYDLQVIDFSDLEPNKYLQLRNGIANTHFAKAGNIYIASRIKNELNLYLSNNPIKCEFGLSKKAEHEL